MQFCTWSKPVVNGVCFLMIFRHIPQFGSFVVGLLLFGKWEQAMDMLVKKVRTDADWTASSNDERGFDDGKKLRVANDT